MERAKAAVDEFIDESPGGLGAGNISGLGGGASVAEDENNEENESIGGGSLIFESGPTTGASSGTVSPTGDHSFPQTPPSRRMSSAVSSVATAARRAAGVVRGAAQVLVGRGGDARVGIIDSSQGNPNLDRRGSLLMSIDENEDETGINLSGALSNTSISSPARRVLSSPGQSDISGEIRSATASPKKKRRKQPISQLADSSLRNTMTDTGAVEGLAAYAHDLLAKHGRSAEPAEVVQALLYAAAATKNSAGNTRGALKGLRSLGNATISPTVALL